VLSAIRAPQLPPLPLSAGGRSRADSGGAASLPHSRDGSLESMTEGSTCDEAEAGGAARAPPTPVALHHYSGTGGLKSMTIVASPRSGYEEDIVSPLSPVGGRKGFGGGARRRASLFFGKGLKA